MTPNSPVLAITFLMLTSIADRVSTEFSDNDDTITFDNKVEGMLLSPFPNSI